MLRALGGRVRSWPRPTARGFVALGGGAVVVVAGLLLGAAPLVFAGAAVVALVLAAVATVLVRAPRIQVARRFSPDRAVAGWSVTETVTVTAPGATGHVTLRVREGLPWRRMHSDEAELADIAPGEAARVRFEHVDLPRGRHRIGPARIDLVESFGLARRHVEATGRAELVVFPEIVGVASGRESSALGEGARQRRDLALSGGQDDPITREYRRGDPMRRVHWRQTARQGELMVRQEEQHALPSVRTILPLGRESWPDWHPALGSGAPVSDGFEWAVSFLASLALDHGLGGSQTRVVSLDGATVGVHEPATTPLFLESLADLALDDAPVDPAPEPAPREPVLAVVSHLDDAELVRLGHLRSPGVTGVAVVVRVDAEGVAADSDRVAESLRASGWRVVEATSTSDREEVLRSPGVLDG